MCVCVANLGRVAATLEIVRSLTVSSLIKVGICLDMFVIGGRNLIRDRRFKFEDYIGR